MEFREASVMDNPGLREYMARRTGINGKQQKALAVKRISTMQRVKASGVAKDATVLNFNPVPLREEGGINYKVPSIIDPSIPEDVRMKFTYKGKEYRASLLTITDPFVYPIITDVQ